MAAITGSESTLLFSCEPSIRLLEQFEIPWPTTIVSVRRSAQLLHTFAFQSGIQRSQGDHLSGMTVSMPALLVLGVTLNATSLRGMDSLLTIAQMPAVSSFCLLSSPATRRLFTCRMSVGTIRINNSAKAAELGARILALDDAEVRLRSNQNLEKQTAAVVENSKKMKRGGFDKYLIHYGKGWSAIHE